MTDVHARLSPSRADRYMNCPGSVVLEAGYPDESSIYADEGSAAHLLASWCLTDGTEADSYIGEVIAIGERKFTVDKDMARYVADYVKLVREMSAGHSLLVEQKVPIGHLTGEPGAEGTSDAVIIKASERNLTVIDLKYGMGVVVEAYENPQGMKYALGALEKFDMLAEFDEVTIIIHMPRLNFVSEYHLSVADLRAFGDKVGGAAKRVREAEATHAEMYAPTWAATFLNPGEKQCKFCRAKAGCPALAAEVAGVVGETATAADFADLVVTEITAETGDNFLSHAMAKVDLIELFCKSLRAEIERRLAAGQQVEGWKLVEGKRGPRQWTSAEEAEKLLKSMRLKVDEMYDMKVISPTTAEKVLKDSPKRWERAKGLITQSGGKPSVAPASDKRAALTVHTATAEDFSGLVTANSE